MEISPEQLAKISERVMNLEILFTHLEQRAQELHDVLLEVTRRTDLVERQIRAVADRHSELEGRLQEPRDPAAEKPPHY